MISLIILQSTLWSYTYSSLNTWDFFWYNLKCRFKTDVPYANSDIDFLLQWMQRIILFPYAWKNIFQNKKLNPFWMTYCFSCLNMMSFTLCWSLIFCFIIINNLHLLILNIKNCYCFECLWINCTKLVNSYKI